MKPGMFFLPLAVSLLTAFAAEAFTISGDTNKKDAQGRRQGYWVENIGPTKWEGNYVNDKKQGVWLSHHFNGVLDELTIYKDNLRNGIDIMVDMNGYYKGESTYKNDTLNGRSVEFLPGTAGKMASEVYYNMGQIDGMRSVFYPTGNKEEVGMYKDNKRNGETKWYYQSGKPATSYIYVMDMRSGPFESYYENGNILSKGTFKNNQYQGDYFEFYEDGKLKTTGTYKDDAKTGEWKEYAEDGRVQKQGTYADGKKTGKWIEYNDDFTQLTTTDYKNDKVLGKPSVKKVTPPPVPKEKDDKKK